MEKARKKSDPIDTMIECISDFVEAQYEDSELTDSDLALSKRRFRNAIYFIVLSIMEDIDEKKQIQSHTST